MPKYLKPNAEKPSQSVLQPNGHRTATAKGLLYPLSTKGQGDDAVAEGRGKNEEIAHHIRSWLLENCCLSCFKEVKRGGTHGEGNKSHLRSKKR